MPDLSASLAYRTLGPWMGTGPNGQQAARFGARSARTGMQMMVSMKAAVLVALLLASPCVALAAAKYDGSAPMKCTIEAVFVCPEAALCTRGTAQTVSLPPVVTVDVANRVISGAATGRTAQITAVGRGAGQLLGKAWGLNVNEDNGTMSGAVLSPVGGFLMFGACSAL
jgi:hypothetical protein